MDITIDTILGGRVQIAQPAQGFRIAIDTVLLAAAIDAQPHDTILDVGSGVGAAALCLAARQPDCRVIGLERQRPLVRFAADNIQRNHMNHRVEVLWGDLCQPPPRLAAGTYAHVMTNPPYLEEQRMRPSSNPSKQTANSEQSANLEQWLKFCLLMVRPKGCITLIHRADRLHEILHLLTGKLGNIMIFPIWSHAQKPAKRVIIRGRKNSQAPTVLSPGLLMHRATGEYTAEAEAILRHAQPLVID